MTDDRTRQLVALCGLTVFVAVLIRTAWVCDDAYIAFRTVDNFVHGYGLRWNVNERVWSYTNPLWVLVVSAVYFVTREMYFTSIFLSIAIAVATLYILNRELSKSVGVSALLFVVFSFSKAFTDYSTSGLENVLTHFLLAIFMVLWLRESAHEKKLFRMSLVASLIAVNRMDTILLVLPALVCAWWQQRSWVSTKIVLRGFWPFIVWELFALFYYGFPFPNTYYAKVHTGIPAIDLVYQGLLYFLDSLQVDPLTLTTIFLAIGSAVVVRKGRLTAIVVGICLYLFFTVKVGGDFMSGRFFTAPLVCAVTVLTQLPLPQSGWSSVVPAALALLVGFSSPRVPIRCAESYGTTGEGGINPRGIADERGWYYQSTGLLRAKRGSIFPDHEWTHKGLEAKYRKDRRVYDGCVGFMGFFAGPDVHIVDMYALTQPLLSRLPIDNIKGWRIGHFARMYPPGFDQTRDPNENNISDSGMHVYYDKLSTLTGGSLFSPARAWEIVKFNLGRYDSLLEQFAHPQASEVAYEEAGRPKPLHTPWDSAGTFKLNRAGIHIALTQLSHAPKLECSVDHNDCYLLIFRQNSEEVGYVTIERKFIEHGGLRIDTLAVPTEAALRGYDRIDVTGFAGDGLYALGHVTLLE